jgi:hypothetical protein
MCGHLYCLVMPRVAFVETARPNGVLMAQIVPRGGRLQDVLALFPWTDGNQRCCHKSELIDGVHINWPSLGQVVVLSQAQWKQEL